MTGSDHSSVTDLLPLANNIIRISEQAKSTDPYEGLPIYFNFRDLGGLETEDGRRVRQGMLFRGASLHRLEVDQLELVSSVEFKSALDLRTSAEIREGTYGGTATLHHLPLFERSPEFRQPIEDVARVLADTYLWMLEEGSASIVAGLELLSYPDTYPLVVYCAAGKDRTGVFCAMLLRLLGVDSAQIVADYIRSDKAAQALREWRASSHPAGPDPVPGDIYRAPERALSLFFDGITDRFGSLEDFLADSGTNVPDLRRALTENLLEG